MDKGALVPDELVLKLIEERLAAARRRVRLHPGRLPAHGGAGRDADARCSRRRGSRQLDKVIAIIVPDEEIVKRISGRRTCKNCGAMYHLIYDPPRNHESVQ